MSGNPAPLAPAPRPGHAPPMPRIQIAIIPVTPFQQNCSLVWEEGAEGCMVVDPGGESERIMAAIGKYNLTVDQIVLTHGHLDHAGGAATLKRVLDTRNTQTGRPPVPLIGPDRRDRFLLDSIEEMAAKHGLEGLHNATPDRWLAEGDTLAQGSLRFDVLHCPGHTPGSLVYLERTARFALVGDVLFQGSVGRTDFPYGDHDALITSILEKLLPAGDDIAFLCGHGPASTFGRERVSNPYLQG